VRLSGEVTAIVVEYESPRLAFARRGRQRSPDAIPDLQRHGISPRMLGEPIPLTQAAASDAALQDVP
jgi:hypothetical protein